MSSPKLKQKILQKELFAYADDIIIQCKDVTELKHVINEFEKLKPSWNLKLSKKKSIILAPKMFCTSQRKKNINKIGGINFTHETKYLGVKISHSKTRLVKSIKDKVTTSFFQSVKELRGLKANAKAKVHTQVVEAVLTY